MWFMSIGSDIYVFVWMGFVLVSNYLMSGYMVCAKDDYLKFIYGGNFGGFKL